MLSYKLSTFWLVERWVNIWLNHRFHIMRQPSFILAFVLVKRTFEPILITRYNLTVIFMVWIFCPSYKIFRILKWIGKFTSFPSQDLQLVSQFFLINLFFFFFIRIWVPLIRLGEGGSCAGMTLFLRMDILQLFVNRYWLFYINSTMTFKFWQVYVLALKLCHLRKIFLHLFENIIFMHFI